MQSGIDHKHCMQLEKKMTRYTDRHRECTSALCAAQERADAVEAQCHQLRTDAASKNSTISWLEQQVQAAQEVRIQSYANKYAASIVPHIFTRHRPPHALAHRTEYGASPASVPL
jgi:hypothetical protein